MPGSWSLQSHPCTVGFPLATSLLNPTQNLSPLCPCSSPLFKMQQHFRSLRLYCAFPNADIAPAVGDGRRSPRGLGRRTVSAGLLLALWPLCPINGLREFDTEGLSARGFGVGLGSLHIVRPCHAEPRFQAVIQSPVRNCCKGVEGTSGSRRRRRGGILTTAQA